MTLAGRIERLDHLSGAELAAEYETITGRSPRYRSVPWLRKRIAFEIQTRLYGGLPSRARAELARLDADLHLPTAAPAAPPPTAPAPRPRTGHPRPGTVLSRDWRGQRITVEVTTDGFVWAGAKYASLSAVAKAITGSKWNGRLFFGLTERSSK
jgi:hypothetical protein